MIRRTFASLALTCPLLGLSAPSLDAAPLSGPAWQPIRVTAKPVPLNVNQPSQRAVGEFRYVGGLHLESDSDLFHELSDIEIGVGGNLIAVGDSGVQFEGRIVLDAAGRPIGLKDSRIAVLTGPDGKPLTAKEDTDAEGLALLPNGDRLISFERNDRILRYPAEGGFPQAVPKPNVSFENNIGMEALGADPEAGPDAYVVGAEGSGQTWRCRISAKICQPGPPIAMPPGYNLVALKRLPGDRTAWLLRAYDAATDITHIRFEIRHGTQSLARLEMTQPLTVDNFEGFSALPLPGGGYRLYLMSDDNDKPRQRTLLLTFDWKPR